MNSHQITRGVPGFWRRWLGRRSDSRGTSWVCFVQIEKHFPQPEWFTAWPAAQRYHEMRSRMPSTGTSGSVGALAEQSPVRPDHLPRMRRVRVVASALYPRWTIHGENTYVSIKKAIACKASSQTGPI